MDKLNIQSLFGHSSKKPNTISLFKPQKRIDLLKEQMTIKHINDMKNRKKELNRRSYRSILRLCLIKIENATKIDQNYLYYEIISYKHNFYYTSNS